jgi:protocatechuate 3,4-dioxygenase beta subunit
MRAQSSYSGALAILLVLASARAQNPAPNPAPAAQNALKEKCAVSGTVVADETGVPLAKAGVILRPIHSGDDTSYATTTGADGKFSLTGVEPGKYVLAINRTGYISQSYNATGSRHQPETLDLQPGQGMNDLKVKLVAQAVIVGRVLDTDGEPLPDVQVQCQRPMFNSGEKVMAPAGFASTNDLGEFRIYGLSPGKCYLSARRLQGPVTGEHVIMEGPKRSYALTYYSSATDISAASPVAVSAGQTVRGIDITLLPVAAYHVSGYVKNIPNGKSVFIQLTHAGGSLNVLETARFQMARSRDGYFDFTGIPPGDYVVSTQPIGSGNDRLAATQPVSVEDKDVSTLNLILTPVPSLSAQIASTDPTACPPVNTSVVLQPKVRLPYGGWAQGNADENGQLKLDGVALTAYSINVFNIADGCYVASIRLGDEAVADGQLDFSEGIPAGQLTLTISPRAPTVSGTVKDANDSPAVGVRVVLVPADPARHWSALFHTATTDQNGSYSLKNLIPGDYQAYAWQDIPAGAWQDPDILKQFSTRAASVNLKPGDNLSQDLAVIPASETKDIE